MKRSGFKRPQLERKPPVVLPLDPKHRRAVSYALGETQAAPKNPPGRNAAYRELARDKPCMLQIPYVCSHDPQTTVLAHSNSQAHGKGMGLKADDAIGSVWACYACHTWIDQGDAPAAAKELAFRRGAQRMEAALKDLLASPLTKERDRNAAQWALDRIQAQRAG